MLIDHWLHAAFLHFLNSAVELSLRHGDCPPRGVNGKGVENSSAIGWGAVPWEKVGTLVIPKGSRHNSSLHTWVSTITQGHPQHPHQGGFHQLALFPSQKSEDSKKSISIIVTAVRQLLRHTLYTHYLISCYLQHLEVSTCYYPHCLEEQTKILPQLSDPDNFQGRIIWFSTFCSF